ncbi:hypothetical protein M8C21_009972, partial [Ambrosia artemisiifolia]
KQHNTTTIIKHFQMSSCSIENQNPNNNPSSPLTNWSNLWSKNKKALDHVVYSTLRRRSFYRKPPPPSPYRPSSPPPPPPPSRPPPPPPLNNQTLNQETLVPVSEVDLGLQRLCVKYPNLQRLVVANCSEIGLLNVAEGCLTMQELVLHRCDDQVLRGIAAFKNLQILKLVGTVDGFYSSLVTDIGLTILAQGCKRLVKLELRGCEGSYDGIRAIGQCCQMLEELTVCDHRMDDGWLSAVSYCENLKSLRLVSCKRIDESPGLDEHLGCCRMLERLHLERCQLRDKQSLRAVFLVCQSVREMVVKDCWGLKDGVFLNAGLCRRLKFLSLEGCSRLTTGGLESVVLSLKELENLRVISCKNIKEDEVTPALSTLFYSLKNLKWTPDNRSLLSTSLPGSGIGKRGGKFFKKLQI